MSRKVIRTVVGLVGCFFCMGIILGGYLYMSWRAEKIDDSPLISISGENNAYVNICEIREDRFGMVQIVFEAKKTDLRYDFYNYTLGAGEGDYKNISLLFYDETEKEVWKLQTYPYGDKEDVYIA